MVQLAHKPLADSMVAVVQEVSELMRARVGERATSGLALSLQIAL